MRIPGETLQARKTEVGAHDTLWCSLSAMEEKNLGKDTAMAQPARPEEVPKGHVCEASRSNATAGSLD